MWNKINPYSAWLSLVTVVLLAGCARISDNSSPQPSRLDRITQARVLRVGVAVDAPPFAYLDHQGARQGMDIELVNEIARRLGLEVEWVDAAYNRLPELVRSGKVDAAVGAIAYSEEWDRLADFTQPYYGTGEPEQSDLEQLVIIVPSGETRLEGPVEREHRPASSGGVYSTAG